MSDIYLIPPSIPCINCSQKISIAQIVDVAYGDDIYCDHCGTVNHMSYYGKFLGKIENVKDE